MQQQRNIESKGPKHKIGNRFNVDGASEKFKKYQQLESVTLVTTKRMLHAIYHVSATATDPDNPNPTKQPIRLP